MYITKLVKAGDYVLIKNYTPRLYGAPGRKRQKRMRDTPKAMEKYNNRKRSEKLQMLMILNFEEGFHVVLDYPKDKRPETYEEAEKNLTKCLYKVARRLKKRGIPFKYIAVTERGKRAAALHHHLVIEGCSEVTHELLAAWGNHIKFNHMYKEGAYKDLADYLTKIETKEENTKGKSKYHRSRNLKEPETKIVVMAGTIKDDPRIPEGYEMVPHSLSNGFNELYNVRYQSYMIHKEKGNVHESARKCEPAGSRPEKKSIFNRLKQFFRRVKRE